MFRRSGFDGNPDVMTDITTRSEISRMSVYLPD